MSVTTTYGVIRRTPGLGPVVLGAFVLFTLLLATSFGLLASTADPIFVGLGAGLLVGALVMVRPIWNIWLILIFGLLVAGVVPIWVEGLAAKAVWGISVLGLILMVRAIFEVLTQPARSRSTPAFVWLALIFLIFTVVNSLGQWSSIFEFFGGFKRYYQVIGLLFALAWLDIDESHVRRWRNFFVLVALCQLPLALYERIELVPIREGFAHAFPGMVPIDVVAGTFGAYLYKGGASAEMAAFLIVVLAFLLARLQGRRASKGKILLLLPFVLAPLFLGETKAVVVMLPLMLLTLYRRELLTRPLHTLIMLVVGTLLTVLAGYAYLNNTKTTVDRLIADTVDYNLGEKGYGTLALNRTTVLTFWAREQGLDDPVGAVFGRGLGTAHYVTAGSVSLRYPGFGIDLTTVSTLLWEHGVVGLALYLCIIAFAWRAVGRLRRSVLPDWVRPDLAAIQAVLPVFAFFFIFRNSPLELLSLQIVFFSLLGYLAWLVRRFNESGVTP